jgi:DNA-binding XRE family transcriptional regulator
MDISTPQEQAISHEVKLSKDSYLKERLKTLIKSKGMSEADFYNSIGLSRQYWYALSWGLWNPTIELKCKIASALAVDSSVIFQEKTK